MSGLRERVAEHMYEDAYKRQSSIEADSYTRMRKYMLWAETPERIKDEWRGLADAAIATVLAALRDERVVEAALDASLPDCIHPAEYVDTQSFADAITEAQKDAVRRVIEAAIAAMQKPEGEGVRCNVHTHSK